MNWDIKFILQQGNLYDNSNYVGIRDNASDYYDSFDVPEPPSTLSEDYISLYFSKNNWNEYSGDYTRDVHNASLTLNEWDLP